jgi:hypothetical protein
VFCVWEVGGCLQGADARNRRRLASGPNIASEIDPVLARVLTRTRQ